MKYLGLAYYSPEKFAAMSPEAVDALVSQCPALDEKIKQVEAMFVASPVQPEDAPCSSTPQTSTQR